MKVCWNITSKCNRNCKYCFKFNKDDLSLEKNKKVLDNLVKIGVKKISWTGGEPFLYKELPILLKLSKKYGIINSVNTNLTTVDIDNLKEKIENIDRLIISLDFVRDDLNLKYGIGKDYYLHVSKILKKIKDINPDIIIQLNTVLFSGNISRMNELYEEINKYNIDYWKIIRFLPIRGKAYAEKDVLAITDEQFENFVSQFNNRKQKFKIIIHGLTEMEKKHIIVLSSGKLIYSEKGQDVEVKSLI